jgi:hypothetical protein
LRTKRGALTIQHRAVADLGLWRPIIEHRDVVNERALANLGITVSDAYLRVPDSRRTMVTHKFVIPEHVISSINVLNAGIVFQSYEAAGSIAAKIDAIVVDSDRYEPGEPRPTQETIAKAKGLIQSAERNGSKFPKSEIAVYFGEIDITWRVANRLLRLIVFADPVKNALLYFQTDKGEALTRGESIDVNNEGKDLSQQLTWLLG